MEIQSQVGEKGLHVVDETPRRWGESLQGRVACPSPGSDSAMRQLAAPCLGEGKGREDTVGFSLLGWPLKTPCELGVVKCPTDQVEKMKLRGLQHTDSNSRCRTD